MPFTKQDLANFPISFCRKDEVSVIVGPCSAKAWHERTIPLDGRKYHTGGVITFKNGLSFRASFYVDTTTFRFVSSESIYLHIGEDWYQINEPELLTKLQINRQDIYPLTWRTDRPLDHSERPPYTLEDEGRAS
ncbi:MAG TPA: hypothetical protein PKY96_12355 [Flavobacteriales bacterium]|nr:hypothetical protein [Flavobacteriales bacterium]